MPYVSADDRRRQLIDAASSVIRRVGLERATTRLIADEAGASLPSLHYAFQDKDELLAAVCEHWLGLATDLLGRLVPDGCELDDAVRNLMYGFYDWVAADREIGIAQYELLVWAIRNRTGEDLASRFHVAYRSACSAAICRALPEGIDPRGIDELTATMSTILDGCLIRLLAVGDSPAARADLDRLVAMTIESTRVLHT